VAGPDEQDGRPPGTVHVAVATPAGSRVASPHVRGDRARIRAATVREVLDLALAMLGEQAQPPSR
jgi:nicotinamide-nucleotide amidase